LNPIIASQHDRPALPVRFLDLSRAYQIMSLGRPASDAEDARYPAIRCGQRTFHRRAGTRRRLRKAGRDGRRGACAAICASGGKARGRRVTPIKGIPFFREQFLTSLNRCRNGAPRGDLALETSLYLPVKRFLEGLGFTVKGEVGGCDLVALGTDGAPFVIIGEMKLSFNLELILQAVDRAAACDEVWLAARLSARGKGRESDARFRNLCRRLGFGMLGVSQGGEVSVIVSPEAQMPRKDNRRRSRLVAEHRRRQGDPAIGGGSRAPIMTAYRQQALACAASLADGAKRPRDLRPVAPDAGKILLSNVYGWFARAERGVYTLTGAGQAALARWPQFATACAPLTSADADIAGPLSADPRDPAAVRSQYVTGSA
jgi:hypothetical protein